MAIVSCLIIAAIFGLIWHRQRVPNENLINTFGMEDTSTDLIPVGVLETTRAKVLDGVRANRLIGQGVGGSVFSGTWLGSDVALQLPIGTASDIDVAREINFLVDNTHPNIIQFLGAAQNVSGLDEVNDVPGESSDAPRTWLVFEFAEKGDVSRWLQLERPTVTEILNVMADVASGLMFLASRSIVDRDVSCRNILVKAGPRGALTDLGLARTTNSDAEYKIQNPTSLPVRWCSPELLAQGTASPSSDVFSLGTAMHEALSNGVQPFVGLPNSEVAEHIMGGSDEMSNFLTQPTLCPDVVYTLIRRCWDFDPMSRPSAEEVRDTLHAHTSGHLQQRPSHEVSNDMYGKTPALQRPSHAEASDDVYGKTPALQLDDVYGKTPALQRPSFAELSDDMYGKTPAIASQDFTSSSSEE